MAPRPQMEQELRDIKDEILNMTDLVYETIINAVKSLKEKDLDLARKIIDGDEAIDDAATACWRSSILHINHENG